MGTGCKVAAHEADPCAKLKQTCTYTSLWRSAYLSTGTTLCLPFTSHFCHDYTSRELAHSCCSLLNILTALLTSRSGSTAGETINTSAPLHWPPTCHLCYKKSKGTKLHMGQAICSVQPSHVHNDAARNRRGIATVRSVTVTGRKHHLFQLQKLLHLMLAVLNTRPPLWSSGQSSWLQIRRRRFDSRHYQIFWGGGGGRKTSSGSGTGSTQPREYN
jgi:hypothetical protein